jgi:shikimate kinase
MNRYTPIEFKPSVFDLLEKNIVLYGITGSGKTTILLDLMYTLRHHVSTCIVFSGSETGNDNFKGIVPTPMIHTKPYFNADTGGKSKKTDTLAQINNTLKTILDRQEVSTQVYKNANNQDNLYSLLMKVDSHYKNKALIKISTLKHKRNKIIDRIKHSSELTNEDKTNQIKQCSETFEEITRRIVKATIKQDFDRLMTMTKKLDEQERYALQYIDHDPHLLVIYDDMADILRRYGPKCEFMTAMFYRGRHFKITSIITCQNHNDLPSQMRQNAHLSIFAAPANANGFFITNEANSIDERTKEIVKALIPKIFGSKGTPFQYRKMIYIQNHIHPIQYFTAKEHDKFRVGSDEYWDFCKRIALTKFNLKTNEFSDLYKL